MPMKRIATVAVVALFSVLGVVAIGVHHASAAYACRDNQVCFYEGPNWTGSVFVPWEMSGRAGNVPDFSHRNFTNGTNANDRVTSVINNTGWCVLLFRAAGFLDENGRGNFGWRVKPDTRTNLMRSPFDNRVSSARFEWNVYRVCP